MTWSYFETQNLAPRNHLLRSPTVHVGLIEHNVRSHVCWPGGQHLLLAVNQIAGVKRCQLEPVPVRNRVCRTSLHAISAKDTSIVIDVVDLGVALGAADAVFGGVICSLDVDAIRGTIGGAEEAGHAFFQAVFVALQDVHAAKTFLKFRAFQGAVAVGIVFDDRWLKHLLQSDGHSLSYGSDVFDHGHALLV